MEKFKFSEVLWLIGKQPLTILKLFLLYCFEGATLRYSAFVWILGLTSLAQKNLG